MNEAFPSRSPNSSTSTTPESRIELSRVAALQVLSDLESITGFEEIKNINSLYSNLPKEEYIVRRENPESLIKSLETDSPIGIEFSGNTPYANCVVWNPELDREHGLNTAFLEGQGHLHNIVVVYGFKKPSDLYLEKIAANPSESYGTIDRSHVRAAAGFVPVENIKFVVMRTPISAFPKERMTDDELDKLWEYEERKSGKPGAEFIYRGFMTKE